MLAGCGPKIDQLAATVYVELTQTREVIPTSTLTPTSTFTLTSSATCTATPTPDPTFTPTITRTPAPSATVTTNPDLMASVKYDGTNLRFGPSTDFPVVARLEQGTELVLLGRGQDGQWMVVGMSNGTQGWIALELLNVQIDPSSLTVIETPPQPELYKLTIRNDIFLGHYRVYGPHGDVELELPDGLTYFSVMLPGGTYTFQVCDPWLLLSYNKCGAEFSLTISGNKTITLSSIFASKAGSKP